MAGGTTRYRDAHTAGSRGRNLPDGLASMADADPLIDEAHDAGRNGVPFDQFASERGLATPPGRAPRGSSGPKGSRGARGRSSSRSVTRSPRVPRPTPTQPLAPLSAGPRNLGASAAGLLVGAVFYALVLSVVEYGPSGPMLWFRAKFLNEPAPPPAGAKPTSTVTA